MERKTKVVLAIVAGAIAVGLALSVASCSARDAAVGGETAPAEASSSSQTQEQDEAEEETPTSRRVEEDSRTAYERACSKAWSADGAALQLSKGMAVEKGKGGKLHALTISKTSERPAGDQTLITLEGADAETGKAATWTLVLDESGDKATVACDGFKAAGTYTESAPAGPVSVEGIDEGYLGMVGGDAAPLEEALRTFASEQLPQAATISFDGQATADFNEGSVTATFHADDPAKTVVTVKYANGKFAVSK